VGDASAYERVPVGTNDWMETGIYRLRFSDGSCYLGSSTRASKRMANHLWTLQNGEHYNAAVQSAWGRHNAVSCEMVLICREEDLLFYEQLCLDGLNPSLNHNLAGRSSEPPSEATRLKMSLSMKGENTRPRTQEWKEKISKTLLERGRKEIRPDDVRAKIAKTSQSMWDKRSPEERAKIMEKAWATRRARRDSLNG
jgi:hypothetical protein